MAICPECRKQFPEDVADCPEHGIPLLPEAVFSNQDTELEPETRVGDYEIESLLGEGSFGRVYRAVHPVIGRRVAIKVLNRALSTDPHAVSRFIAEARAIVEVDSPHIVDIYNFGALEDGRQYYVMQLLDGTSLESYLQQHGALDVPVALRILAGMADALCAAHAADVVHRDLKPDNVFVAFDKQDRPVPKLLDFGVAKLLGNRKLGHRTSTGALLGTPAYMAPEQAVGMEVDHRADIYAFGIVAFEMLTGQLPFQANSVVELVRMHTSSPPPALSTVRPELGKGFDAVLLRILAKDPEERPATMEAAYGELRKAALEAGYQVTLPEIVSLRPPPAKPSQPEGSAPSWEAETVPVEQPSADGPGERETATGADKVGGTMGAATVMSQRRPTGHSAARWAIGGAAAVLLGGGLFAVARSGGTAPSSSAEPSAIPSTASAPPPQSATAQTAAPAQPETIELRVEAPDGARLFDGDRDLGPTPGPFEIDRGTEAIRLEVRADGYEPTTLTVVPDQTQTERATMRRKQRPPGAVPRLTAPRPQPPATGAAISPELDVPYEQ